MGYYTYYTLDIEGMKKEEKPDVVKAFQSLDLIGYVFDEYLESCDSVKWYEHDDDMLKISKQFPNMLFCLHGEGEDSTDLWDTYYKAGKMQHCEAEIVYPPFDESKLR